MRPAQPDCKASARMLQLQALAAMTRKAAHRHLCPLAIPPEHTQAGSNRSSACLFEHLIS